MLCDKAEIVINNNVLSVQGQIDFDTVMPLKKAGENYFKQGAQKDWICDFSQVTKSNSATLALIFAWKRFAKSNQQVLKMTHIPDAVMSLAQACHVSDLIGSE